MYEKTIYLCKSYFILFDDAKVRRKSRPSKSFQRIAQNLQRKGRQEDFLRTPRMVRGE